MKKALALFAVVLTLGLSVAQDADAKRLGGGKSLGMQRQQTTTAPNTPPSQTGAAPAAGQNAAPAAAAAPGAAAAAAPKRSWAGPLTGLAAGLGLAALASYFGFGEALANAMLIGLLVMAVLLVVGFIMRRRSGQGPALAGAGAGGAARSPAFGNAATYRQQAGDANQGSMIGSGIGSRLSGTVAAPGASNIPADFDAPAFERQAKSQFMALQSANDARDLDRLRDYVSPEMFEVVRADLAERGDAPQKTEVFGLEARVLEVAEEGDQYVVSVHFTGSIRDQHGAVPEDLSEVWHLSKPRSGFGGWVIAGIQQVEGSAR